MQINNNNQKTTTKASIPIRMKGFQAFLATT